MVKDREAWCAAVHEVTKSQIWLSDWSTTTRYLKQSSFLSPKETVSLDWNYKYECLHWTRKNISTSFFFFFFLKNDESWVPGAGEAFHSWQRSWGRRLGIRKGGIEPRESPRIFWSIYRPKPESAYFIALCSHLWLYWGLSPTTISLSLSKS